MKLTELQMGQVRSHLNAIFELREELKERLTSTDYELACIRQLLNGTDTGGRTDHRGTGRPSHNRPVLFSHCMPQP